MQKNQYLLLGGALLFAAALYFFADFRGLEQRRKASEASTHSPESHEGAPAAVEPMDIEAYRKKETDKLPESERQRISTLLQTAEAKNTAVAWKDVAEFWEKSKELNLAARYYKTAAFLENTEKSVTFAGNLLLALMVRTEEPAVRMWQSQEAIACFTKALDLNPGNLDTKIALATCYTDGTGETMKGVTLLREVTAKDSLNVPANLQLGKMALQSGQLDKAVRRLELILEQDPKNSEAMYFLAEAYKGLGQKEKAISLFERCTALVNNPDFSREIDNYIKTFR